MHHVLVRYSAIGTKSDPVEARMAALLRDRVTERLDYEGVDAGVTRIGGRILVDTTPASADEEATDEEAANTEALDADAAVAGSAAAAAAELPGVASASPAIRTSPEIPAIEAAATRFDVGDTIAIDASTAGNQQFSSRDVNEQVGAAVVNETGAGVDLDDPDTRIEVDVRPEGAFLFTERFEGPGGLPAGAQDPVAALVSGGIDSPVAAYEMLTRGADVVPIYFYNRPVAAEDHLARFEAAVAELRRFHPASDWHYHVVDMEAVNERLRTVESGRMVLHRAVMFRVAERIARDEGLRGIVTGEVVGQKSSQTVANLEQTGRGVDLPIHRPLLTETKDAITERARALGTFDLATIDSACRTIAPDNPATGMDRERFDDLAADVDLPALVETAYDTVEQASLSD